MIYLNYHWTAELKKKVLIFGRRFIGQLSGALFIPNRWFLHKRVFLVGDDPYLQVHYSTNERRLNETRSTDAQIHPQWPSLTRFGVVM